MSALTISGLSKHYGTSAAIQQVDLTLGDGAFTTLLGPSGCGKTTTLRCLAGLEVPTTGRIVHGENTLVDVESGHFVAPNKRRLGMVFQSYALWPNRTVRGNVTYPLKLRRTPRHDIRRRAEEALEAVNLGHLGEKYPHELSGGQQQRVALARGLVSTNELMLFDEPLSNLDAKLRMSMRTEIRRLHDHYGHSTVYVTHDQDEALAISDQIVVMNNGLIEQAGTPQEIFQQPASQFVAQFVGFDNILTITEVNPNQHQAQLEGGGSFTFNAADVATDTQMAFRSTDVTINPEDHVPDGYLGFTGTVTTSIYAGDSYLLTLDIGGTNTLTATVPDASKTLVPDKYVGDRMNLLVATDNTVRF